MIVADISFITPLIFLLCFAGIFISGYWAFKISTELHHSKNGKKVHQKITPIISSISNHSLESIRNILSSRIAVIRYIAWALVVFGLIGTILGFIIVLTNIDPTIVGNVSKVGELMATITNGLGVALYTTLAGTFGNLWLLTNFNMLQTATIQLYSRILLDMDNV